MKLSFHKDSDFTEGKLAKFQQMLADDKSSVVLHHSEYCGHCWAMREEFEKFKKSTKHHVAEIEGGVLDKLQQNKKIYNKVGPKGGMYFPMIIIFIKRDGCAAHKKYMYDGPRTEEGLKSFIADKEQASKKPLKKKPHNKK